MVTVHRPHKDALTQAIDHTSGTQCARLFFAV